MKFFSTIRAFCALMLLSWASFAHASACAPLGTLTPLGAPLAAFETFEAGGAFERCYSFELTTPGDVGPFAVGESGAQLIATLATWSVGPMVTTATNLVVEGLIGIAVTNPGLAVNLGNVPSGAYEVFLTGTSGGPGSGVGLILTAIPLAAVPEPETWALFLAALSIAGFIRPRARAQLA